jgi:hypothetical protein
MQIPAGRLRTFFEPHIMASAIRVSLLVGTVLNLVNQGPALVAHTGISWPKVAMNYLVPFCVATYSAAANQWRTRAAQGGD